MSDVTPNTQAKRVGWVLRGTRYSGTALLVFVVLAERSNEKGFCWPSVASIAEDSRCSERSVQYAIRQLVAEGWVLVHRQRGEKGANVYRINLTRLEKSFQVAETERRRRYIAEPQEESFETRENQHQPCGKPEDNGMVPEEISMKTVDKSGSIGGNAEDASGQGVQVATQNVLQIAPQGCKAFAPKPQGTPTNPNGKAKTKAYCYDGKEILKTSNLPRRPP